MDRPAEKLATFKVAENKFERELCFQLVHDAYLDEGLISPNTHGMRVTKYHAQPTTAVFLAMSIASSRFPESVPIYTATLIPDGDIGIPLDEIYLSKVDEMRSAGHYVAEVSCLAGNRTLLDRREQFGVFVGLMGLIGTYSKFHGITRILVAVHPRHAKFYQRFFGFQQFGDKTSYAAVEGNPAIGCYHDFVDAESLGYPLQEQTYAIAYADHQLLAHPMGAAEREILADVIDCSGGSVIPLGSG